MMAPRPIDTMFGDKDRFSTIDGRDCILLYPNKNGNLRIYEVTKDSSWQVEGGYGIIFASNVKIDVLKEINVWDKFSKKIQEKIIAKQEDEEKKAVEKMGHARSFKRVKYPNIPKELSCCKCDNVDKVSPSITAAKIGKLDISVEKYVEGYECRICNPPKRGRKSNPVNAPKDLVCKCGKKVTYPMSVIKKRAAEKKMKVNEFIKGYKCQKCNPTKGRKKGQKNKKK